MRRTVIAALAAGVLVGGGATAATAALASSTTARVPECVKVEIVDNSGNGPNLFTEWCGTGAGGESPMSDNVKQLVVDGTMLRARNCTRLNPCFIQWPGSPVESGDTNGSS